MLENWIDTIEASQILRVDPSTVIYHVGAGNIRGKRLRRDYMIWKPDVLDLQTRLAKRTKTGPRRRV